MSAQLTLLLPGLLEAASHLENSIPRLPALEVLLSRADGSDMHCSGYHPCVDKLFDHQGTGSLAPNAAVARLGEGGKPDQRIWLHLDPVYMQADKDRLLLRGNALLGLSKLEVSTLMDELNELYREDNYCFESYHPQRWYLGIEDDPECSFSLLSDVLGRNVEVFLPTGNKQTHWRRFMNEVQMYLHASDINQQRLEEQAYPVNSIWCWGNGVVSEVSASWDAVYSNDPLLAGLAQLSDSLSYPIPDSAVELLKQLPSDRSGEAEILVAFSQTEHHILSNDNDFWRQYLLNLEKHWFLPLVESLKNRQIDRLDMITTNGMRYTLDKKNLGKWWRRRQLITHYLNS